MWLLPGRTNHAGDLPAQHQSQAHRCGYRPGDGGKHLPLRNLSAHPRRHQGGGGGKRMTTITNLSRRRFLRGMFSTCALVLGASFAPDLLFAQTGERKRRSGASVLQPNVFVAIETDGTVRIVAHRSEMGTGIRTSLPLVLADELDADWSRVKIDQAIGDA